MVVASRQVIGLRWQTLFHELVFDIRDFIFQEVNDLFGIALVLGVKHDFVFSRSWNRHRKNSRSETGLKQPDFDTWRS